MKVRAPGIAVSSTGRNVRRAGAEARASANPTVEFEQRTATGVCNLFLVIQPRRFFVVDPLERHSRYVRTKDKLGERATYVARDEVQTGREPIVCLFEVDAQHEACKIDQSYARIQRRKTFI